MNCNRFTFAGLLLLASCGGGNEPASTAPQHSPNITAGVTTSGTATSGTGTLAPAAAAHFLGQASFGATSATINELSSLGKSAWITAQFTKPQVLHRDYVQQFTGAALSSTLFQESFWRQAAQGDDQLRQRVTYALSQIFVVSFMDSSVAGRVTGMADYYDTLGRYAFGNFRDLLQAVALHPMMGAYLSHMHNQKENGTRVPDENFAREIMQLMTIGLYQLNQDGSVKTSGGVPIETYTHDDVAGLAKVFTGWSWSGPDRSTLRFFSGAPDPAREWTPMQMYPAFHSTSTKTFLGVSTNGTGEADLKVALDTLFNHPNVGPFIGRQLIQRLVTSNPNAAYISRVAAAFNNNGNGVRGDMRAVLRAILLDPEAADKGHPRKLREPVVRLANWMRAFNVKSTSGRFLIGNLDDPLTGIGQAPLRSLSVFNFYRPSYSPPNTTLSAARLVAPEMQITGEPSVTGYLNFMLITIPNGTGTKLDVVPDYTNELALIGSPEQLVDRVQLLLMGGGMSTTLRNQIISAVSAITPPASGDVVATENARKNRVYMAIFLTMASPEYLAQR
ncbi:Uncharacterized conserved protein, DUF1800 family [Duganella sp. CF402]|uniref:DUF1800 domain-containing protein n=1 Tax=unclassified Duganella TaxID=2636909 RepID=UPI0008D84558|nr:MULTISPECIES: DUF1800 domain-containing protein [unclassified Duganella]RZT10689.1 uncharacterized protein (DUF1800 family) [Duganella sp. BK701]SEL01877.1 Uncharacterized conserved protein, DUF1800 family [Duganella sp. CF402]